MSLVPEFEWNGGLAPMDVGVFSFGSTGAQTPDSIRSQAERKGGGRNGGDRAQEICETAGVPGWHGGLAGWHGEQGSGQVVGGFSSAVESAREGGTHESR